MGRADPFGEIQRTRRPARYRHAQERLVRQRVQQSRHGAMFQIEPILVEPPLRRIKPHDVDRNRQAFRRQLAVDIDMAAIQHQLARREHRAFDKPQPRILTRIARHRLVIILVVIAGIARPAIAHSQKIEIVIMRRAVDEAGSTGGLEHMVAGAGPDRRAQEGGTGAIIARAAEHDRLRTVPAGNGIPAPPRQPVDQ